MCERDTQVSWLIGIYAHVPILGEEGMGFDNE